MKPGKRKDRQKQKGKRLRSNRGVPDRPKPSPKTSSGGGAMHIPSPFDQYKVGGIASVIGETKHQGATERPRSTKSTKLTKLFGQSEQSLRTVSTSVSRESNTESTVAKNAKRKKPQTKEKRLKLDQGDSKQSKGATPSTKQKPKQSKALLNREEGLRNAENTATPNKKKRKHDTDETTNVKKKQKKGKPEPRNPEQEKRTVFVGNVPVSAAKKDLKKLFGKFGEVESMRLRSAAPSTLSLPKKVIMIQKDFHPERNNMNVYVVFKDEESAKKALKVHGKEFQGHHLRVDIASNTEKHNNRSVFVGNLPYSVHEEIVRAHFGKCGDVEDVRLVRDATTGLGKGFGYVLFADPSSVEFALKFNQKQLLGRPLRIKRAVKKEKTTAQSAGKHPHKFQKMTGAAWRLEKKKKRTKQQ